MEKYQRGGVPDEELGGEGGEIDLGQMPEGLGPGMDAMPTGGGAAPPSGPEYPSVMLTGDEGLSKIPDSGRCTIHHSVKSRRVHTPQHGRHKGKKRHEVEIHIHKIKPIRAYKKAPSKSKRSDDERAMKKLLGDESEEE
jgi:hypothetical protein